MEFDYAETSAVIRIRSFNIKGLVNETYELLRTATRICLAGKVSNSQRGSHGTMSPGRVEGFGGIANEE
jgi:hypothetical protein